MQLIRRSELVDTPWKNGGGTTRRIAIGSGEDGTAWTLSLADVAQDGPFSDFAGMVRLLTVLSGGSMTLHAPNQTFTAKPGEPVRFDGGLQVEAHLEEGPLSDLNLMFDPTICEGKVSRLDGPTNRTIAEPVNGLIALHALSGNPTVDTTVLHIGDTAFYEQTAPNVSLGDGDALLEVRLNYLPQSAAVRLCIAER